MKASSLLLLIVFSFVFFTSYSQELVNLNSSNLELINRKITSKKTSKSVALDNKQGDGMAIVKSVSFETGTIELELKGENKPGRSFVGLSFNIQNDSTYEAVYFRPFNFQAKDLVKREHSIQYISLPKNEWRYLRTNYEGQYEAEYPRKPSPDEWFALSIKITEKEVTIVDKETGAELLNVERIGKNASSQIGLWTGNNSKGAFRNLRILK